MSVVKVTDKVIVLVINNSYDAVECAPAHDKAQALYEVTRGVWRVGKRAAKAEYALGLYKGKVKEVYRIREWHAAGTLPYCHRKKVNTHIRGRWEFKGAIADKATRNRYRGKRINVRPYGGLTYAHC